MAAQEQAQRLALENESLKVCPLCLKAAPFPAISWAIVSTFLCIVVCASTIESKPGLKLCGKPHYSIVITKIQAHGLGY